MSSFFCLGHGTVDIHGTARVGDEDYGQQQESRSSRADAGGIGANLLEESKQEPQHTQQHAAVVCDFFIFNMCVSVCLCLCLCLCLYSYIYSYIYTYMYAQQHAGMVRVGCLSLSCNEAVVGASHDLTPSPAPATRVYTQEELKQLYLLQQQKKSATTSFSVPSTLYGLHHTQHPIQAPYGGQATYGGGGGCAWGGEGGVPVPSATAACSPSTASPSSVGALVLASSGNLGTIKVSLQCPLSVHILWR